MKLSSIKYYFKEGFSGMLKNRLMTVASVATVAACIFIMSFSYCIVNNLSYMLGQLEDKVGVVAILNDELNADEVNHISEEINALPHVKTVTYISPDEALEDLQEEWGTQGILDGFSGENNPLSKSFDIAIDGIRSTGDVVKSIESIEGVKSVRHAQTATEMLMKLNKVATIMGSLVILILGVISVVIIMNTIKISVYTRRTEINIMKYVGATNWFIRWPFVIEGVLIGLIGAVIPIAIAWPAYGKMVDVVYDYLPILNNMVEFRNSADIFSLLVPIALLFGILLGVVGSVSSIRKHLNV